MQRGGHGREIDMRPLTGAGDARFDERESTPDAIGEETVGLRSVPDHQHRRRWRTDQVAHEVRHRLLGFAGEDRFDAADRRDRSDDGAAAGLQAVRSREGGVAVRPDQPGTVEYRPPRRSHSRVVELAVEPDDHRVDVDGEVGAVVGNRDRTGGFDRFHDACATGDEDPLAGRHQRRRCHGRRHDLTGGTDTDRSECGDVLGDACSGVVRDEHDAPTRPTQTGDRVDGTGDRFVGEPHHAVQIAQHGSDLVWHPVSVPRFTPFPALRYSESTIDDVVAPPYDVLSDSDLDALNARHRFNITHVDVPRESDGPGRYERSGRVLREWIDEGVMRVDDRPTFTLYRLAFTDASGAARDIVGVLGGLEVGPYGECGVLPHERITPKASTDRLDLTRSTGANMSPIWGLSLAEGLTELLVEPADPIATVTIDGVTHTVERVSDPDRIAAISAKMATDDVLIADGHHRYGVAQTFRDETRAATGRENTEAEDTLAFVSELVEDQLSVEAIHRLYGDANIDDLVAALDEGFERSAAGEPSAATLAEMEARGALCLVRPDGSAQWLTPRPGALDDLRALDGLWLEAMLSGVDHSVSYQHGVDRVVDAVVHGDAQAGVLIRPVSVAEIERTAREGVVMPPKSTFFTPKLLTGLVVRPLG